MRLAAVASGLVWCALTASLHAQPAWDPAPFPPPPAAVGPADDLPSILEEELAEPPAQWDSPLPEIQTLPPPEATVPPEAALGVCPFEDPRILKVFYGYDAWRGIADGAWSNHGLHVGLDYGGPVGGWFEGTGLGVQIGGRVGVFNWSGTDYRQQNLDQPTTQGFVTFGLFRRPTYEVPWGVGVVQDWMINNNYGVMGDDPTLFQWRAQVEYALSDFNAVGVWGAWRGHGDSRQIPGFGRVTWRPIKQISAFWHHQWGWGQAETWSYFGLVEDDRLEGHGSLGDYVVGAYSSCPLTDRLAIYSMVNYMHPSASPGPAAAKEDAWNLSLGIALYLHPAARSPTVRGYRWAPLLPVANNGLFLVDTSDTY